MEHSSKITLRLHTRLTKMLTNYITQLYRGMSLGNEDKEWTQENSLGFKWSIKVHRGLIF